MKANVLPINKANQNIEYQNFKKTEIKFDIQKQLRY